jgi:hypothetical protein
VDAELLNRNKFCHGDQEIHGDERLKASSGKDNCGSEVELKNGLLELSVGRVVFHHRTTDQEDDVCGFEDPGVGHQHCRQNLE